MFTLLPRRIIIVIIFFFALGSLGLWYALSFSPPRNVTVTDITSNSAVVAWTTSRPTTSNIYYSPRSRLLNLLPLSYPFIGLSRDNKLTVNHRVLISNLLPSNIYYLSISRWFHFYRVQDINVTDLNSGRIIKRISNAPLPVIKTSSSVILACPESDLSAEALAKGDSGCASLTRMTTISGTVANNKLQPVSGALVIAKTAPGQAYSALTDLKGNFSFSLPLTSKDSVLFFTGQNGVAQIKSIIVAKETLNQPVLIVLP